MDIIVKDKLGVDWIDPKRTLAIADKPQDPELAEVFDAAIPAQSEYNFRKEVMRDFLAFMAHDEPILLYGPTGSGKSSTPIEFAARCGIPVFRLTASANTETCDVFGMYSLVNGETKYVYGPAVKAALVGGIFLLDEADRTPQDVLVGLNGITEGTKPFVIPHTGEIIKPAKGFKVIYTANSNLSGSDIYLTAKQHDPSVPERFLSMKIDYPEDAMEHAILMADFDPRFTDKLVGYMMHEEGAVLKVNGVVKEGKDMTRADLVSGMLQVAALIRAQSRDGGNESASALERTISVRSLGRWLRCIVDFAGAYKNDQSAIHYALRRALTNTCNPSTAVAIHTIVTSVFAVQENLK